VKTVPFLKQKKIHRDGGSSFQSLNSGNAAEHISAVTDHKVNGYLC
jgi:hypothetical protein